MLSRTAVEFTAAQLKGGGTEVGPEGVQEMGLKQGEPVVDAGG